MEILITANNAVSEAGELAQAKSSNEAVKAHARTVNKHHTDVTKSVNELAARLKTMRKIIRSVGNGKQLATKIS